MRIWLDPDKLASYNLSAADALAAVQEQNSQSPGGSLGDRPLAEGSELNATDPHAEPLHDARAVRRDHPARQSGRLGRALRRRGARRARCAELPVEHGAERQAGGRHGGAADTGRERAARRRDGVERAWRSSSAASRRTSPGACRSTRRRSSASRSKRWSRRWSRRWLLVFLVMFLFLQNWRATLIPTIVVPIALAGACLGPVAVRLLDQRADAVRHGAGDRHPGRRRHRRGRERRAHHDARRRSVAVRGDGQGDDQITSAIIGITLVLVAVFVPMAFFPGSTGGIYRQFSVTLAISIAFSALLALTLTPALCATLLKPHVERGHARQRRTSIRRARVLRALQRLVRAHDRSLPGAVSGRSWRGRLRFLAVVRALDRGHDCCCSRACRAASCRRRTRATSSPSCRRRRARRRSAPTKPSSR